jgi:quinol monooxygenase YgiN
MSVSPHCFPGEVSLGAPKMIPRRSFLTLAAAAAVSSQASAAAGGADIFHVAIFRFAKEHIDDAMAAFRALASASRRESGNLSYDIYRGIDDDQEFYVVEHWASPAALAEHERGEAFIHFGQEVLVRRATLHDTVTARPFE